MYRISNNKRKYSTTPIVRVETESGKEKEIPVLFSSLTKKDGDPLMETIVNFLNKK